MPFLILLSVEMGLNYFKPVSKGPLAEEVGILTDMVLGASDTL